MNPDANFEGPPGSTCEHRTVGPHRAWCLTCGEWCYPEDYCVRDRVMNGGEGDIATTILVLNSLGERVAAKRAERGISYREAAAIIGISPSTMYGIESGKRDPGVIVVLRVLRWLTEDGETWEPGKKATGRRST